MCVLLLYCQAALKALERWVAAEGAAVGADSAALRSISDALAKQHTAAQQLSVRPAATRRSKRKRWRRKKVALPPGIAARCVGTAGDWCGEYFLQKPIPGKVRLGVILSTRAIVSMDRAVQLSVQLGGNRVDGTWTVFQAPPRGDKPCPNDCNGVGICQADFGYCLCPAGAFTEAWRRVCAH